MGKRNYGNGIIDRRYRSDDSPSGYKGELPFRAYCHYGVHQYSRCFASYKEALDWKRAQDEQNRNRDNPGYFKRKELETLRGIRVSDIIYNYIQNVNKQLNRAADDLSGPTDLLALHRFAQTAWVAKLCVLDAKRHHFVKYFLVDRPKETFRRKGWQSEKQITRRTVARERAMISRAYQMAIDQNWWEVCYLLENPVSGKNKIKIEGSMFKRTRTLLPGEEEKLVAQFEKCPGLNRHNLPLAFYLALETGMREQEVVGLRWSDIDPELRRIKIRESKTDKKLGEKGMKPGRVIVLPVDSMLALGELWRHLNSEGHLPGSASEIQLPRNVRRPIDDPDSHIFINRYGKPWSTGALGDAFADAVKRANLQPGVNGEVLRFHDLRRAAKGRLYEAGLLDEVERGAMLGHANKSSDATYDDAAREYILRPIQDKLDKHVLKLFVTDDDGKRKLDHDGNPIQYGVTLEEYARVTAGKKVTNLDIWEGRVFIPHIRRHEILLVRQMIGHFTKKAEERMADGKAWVIGYKDKNGQPRNKFEHIGYMTLGEASEITNVRSGILLDMENEKVFDGILSSNGYIFFSEARIRKIVASKGEVFETIEPQALIDHVVRTNTVAQLMELLRDGRRLPTV